MIVLALLVLIVVVLVVTGAASLGRAVPVVLAVLGGLVVLLGVVTVGLGGLRSSGDDDDGAEEIGRATSTTEVTRSEPRTRGVVVEGRRGIDLVLEPAESSERTFPTPAPVVDQLIDGQTILVELQGPERAWLHQCALGPGGQPTVCDTGVPVQATFDAPAIGLVEVHESFMAVGDTVDCGRTPCGLVAFEGDVEVVAVAELVFGRPARHPGLFPTRTRELRAGDRIDVRVDGLSPGDEVGVTWCAPPGSADDCGAPGPVATAVADDAGSAVARLRVPDGPIGAAERACGRGDPCAVALVGGAVAAPVVRVDFAGVPGAGLPLSKVLPGLAVAAALAGAALLLVRRRETTLEDLDPFVGVSLDVPEWEGVVIDDIPEWDDAGVTR